MTHSGNKKLFNKLSNKNISFQHICEVGVYLPECSNIIDFIRQGIRTTLVEADPDTVISIKEYFKEYPITVHPVAIWDHNGTIELSKAAASTFVTALDKSPALVNDNHQRENAHTFTVECKVFSEIDDGSIDLLSVDIEGSEWHVIGKLISRPKVISVETHGKLYTNPYLQEISQWMQQNNYILWYKDLSDSIFVRNDVFQPGLMDKIETAIAEARVAWKKFKRSFRK